MAEEIESRSRIVGWVEPLGGVDELLDRVLQWLDINVLEETKNFCYIKCFILGACYLWNIK
jgi:hypothetical protein